MRILLTGAAGFIGFHTAKALLDRGDDVVGLDNLNSYYSPRLKDARLAQLEPYDRFSFIKADLADGESLLNRLVHESFDAVIHLAAQAGVRYSIDHPFVYADSNLTGHLTILELCRAQKDLQHLVYASSSSVYGGNTKLPFSEGDPVNTPVSLYAATKRSCELMSHTYAHLYGIPQTGLRFFTVYGPWGRPDMAYWSFTKDVLEGNPIRVFNNGELSRDFTYIDDIVAGVIAVLGGPPRVGDSVSHRIFNIGNNKPENLMDFIALIEKLTGKTAEKIMEPMQPGDVYTTYADISAINREFGFTPCTSLEEGLPRFVDWYRSYNG